MIQRPGISSGLGTLLAGLFLGSLSTWAWVALVIVARHIAEAS